MATPADLIDHYAVAIEGFSEFERKALASYFRLAAQRGHAYHPVEQGDASDFVIADADDPRALHAVMAAGRAQDAVFVGAQAPAGSSAWFTRPIDPMHIVRELDALVERRNARHVPDAARHPEVDLFLPEIDLPFYAAATAPAAHTVNAAGPVQQGASGRDVLIVEDSAIARKFLALRMQRLGYRVQLAHTGEEAMAMVACQAFAIAFVDIMLGPPGSVDGLQVCRHIKQRCDRAAGLAPAVVLVTGLAGAMHRVQGSRAGCDAYLTKPLAEAEFIRTLGQVDPAFEPQLVAAKN